jgi:hypothetical protein
MKRLLLQGLLRLVVFGLLGSTIWAALCAADFEFVSFGSDFSMDSLELMLALVPNTFVLGVAYGLIMSLIDFALLRAKQPYRMVAVALAGVAAMNYMLWNGEWLQGAAISVVGALPAALCSLLCGWAAGVPLMGRWLSPTPVLPAE